MPRYRITAPDGRVFDVNAPDGATQEDALGYAKAQWAGIPGKTYPMDLQENIRQNSPDKTAIEALPFGDRLPVNDTTAGLGAALVGAGRTSDKIVEGVRQVNAAADVALREATGRPTRQGLDALRQQEQEQKFRDDAYAPLAKKYPFGTGIGEALPAVAIPVGQATAAGRILAPAFGMSAMGGAEYGSPEQRGLKATKGLALGALGGTVGEVANSVIAPATSRLTATQQRAAENAANRLNVNLLPSQLTGNPNLARIEDTLARRIGSAGVMADFQSGIQRGINRHAAGAMGENADDVSQSTLAAAKARQGTERDALLNGQTMPVTGNVISAIDQSKKMLSSGLAVDGKSETIDLLDGLKDRLYNTRALSGDDFNAIVSDIKSAARGTKNTTIKAALINVQKAMEQASTVDKTLLAKSNAEIAARKTLQMPGVTNEFTGDVYPKTLANRMDTQLGEAMKTGKITGPLADIAEYGKAVPQLRAGSPTYERGVADSLMGYLLSPLFYAGAKGITSQAGRDYLAKGLLGHPGLSSATGKIASRAALPLAMSPAEQALWQMGLLSYAGQPQ